jgi:hypothetical protein
MESVTDGSLRWAVDAESLQDLRIQRGGIPHSARTQIM